MARYLLPLLAIGLALATFGAVATALPALANHPPGPPEKTTICHKPGTEDEAEMTLPHQAARKHLEHGDIEGPCGDIKVG